MKIQSNPSAISRNLNDENRRQSPEQTAQSGEKDHFEELMNKSGKKEAAQEQENKADALQSERAEKASKGSAQQSGESKKASEGAAQQDAKTASAKKQAKGTDHTKQENLLDRRLQHPGMRGGMHKEAGKKHDKLDGDPRLNPGLLATGGTSKLPGETKASEAHATTSPAKLHELTEKIVSRILVSAPGDASKVPEVRITLDHGVMKGTEVTISKEGNELSVSFSAETADAANLLSQQQGVMKQTLSQNLKLDVQISVADAHTQQQQQQDNQGRSRQRRFVQDEQQDA